MDEIKFLEKLKDVIECEELQCCDYKMDGKGSLCYICIAILMIERRLEEQKLNS